jgi:hypothetical protein
MGKYTEAEKAIAEAVYNGEIDGLNTNEVAEKFEIPRPATLKILKKIAAGECTYQPFEFIEVIGGVQVRNGSTFVYGDDGEFMEGRQGFNHYIWFLT